MSGTHHRGVRGALAAAYHYFVEEWPSVFFASAAVTILMHSTSFLNAVDGYAWLVIGNLSSTTEPAVPKPTQAVVVRVDEQANESRYFDRTPLDRCELERDLRAVYDARPKVLAVDLDLSPAHWLSKRDEATTGGERACQAALYALIRERACGGARTVLMTPFREADERQLRDALACPSGSSDPAGVRFGNASLPEEYGLLMSHYTGEAFFAPLAVDAYRDVAPAHAGKPIPEIERIDTRRYPEGNGLELMSTDALPAAASKLAGKAVFFGAAFGEEDLFLTPLGFVYGVHAHAAVFLSMLAPLGEAGALAEFFGELLLAIVFGMLINNMWNGYFRGRVGDDPVGRQTAALRIALLSLALAVAVALLSWLSLLLLQRWGIWLSPVPIAIGMMLDSFVVGAVSNAREELLHQAKIPIDRPVTLAQSVARFAWGDVQRLWPKSPLAATLIAARRALWAAVVAAGLVLQFAH